MTILKQIIAPLALIGFSWPALAIEINMDAQNPCICYDAWHYELGDEKLLEVPKNLSGATCNVRENSLMLISGPDLFTLDIVKDKKGEPSNTICLGISLANGVLSRSYTPDPQKDDLELCQSFLESRGCKFPGAAPKAEKQEEKPSSE